MLLPPAARAHAQWHQTLMLAKITVDIPALAKDVEEMEARLADAEIAGTVALTSEQLCSMLAHRLSRVSSTGNINTVRTTPIKCFICGGAHAMKDCTEKCAECDLNFCPGARGAKCVITCAPSEVPAEFSNALGRPLPEHLVTKLKNARQTHMDKENAVARGQVRVTLTRHGDLDDGDSDAPPALGLIF